jgi:hypothetical protein
LQLAGVVDALWTNNGLGTLMSNCLLFRAIPNLCIRTSASRVKKAADCGGLEGLLTLAVAMPVLCSSVRLHPFFFTDFTTAGSRVDIPIFFNSELHISPLSK